MKNNFDLGLGFSSNNCSSTSIRSIVTSCRAVILPRFGGPEVLQLRDGVGVPDLKPNEVLVRAHAVSINPLDLRVRLSLFFLNCNRIK